MDDDRVLTGQQIMMALRREGQWVARAWYGRDGEDPTPPRSVYVQARDFVSRQRPNAEFVFELAAEQPGSGDWVYDEVARGVSLSDVRVTLMAGSKL